MSPTHPSSTVTSEPTIPTIVPTSSHLASAESDRELVESQDRFISLWGEMGSRWGVPRTMAETHALLFVHGEPLHAEAIMDRLRISRGNVSMTLRTLVEWGIITRHHERGDRREYFRAEQDVWKLFATVARARKRREIDPLVEGLDRCKTAAARGREGARRSVHNARVDELLNAVRIVDGISERLVAADGSGLRTAALTLSKLMGVGGLIGLLPSKSKSRDNRGGRS
ncbi:MAG: MarR family transcriptional regulator [Phycisphaerae bacterium]|jgi:DNA-binding transcriptional regulator GbsR (MarR family)|nr:MarR family transcriptional regulator [Phycisphaerae bacterium]